MHPRVGSPVTESAGKQWARLLVGWCWSDDMDMLNAVSGMMTEGGRKDVSIADVLKPCNLWTSDERYQPSYQ